jgi:uncharacterized protein YndB with AHSA1/START domain
MTMTEQTVIHSTFVIERTFRATPERVFSALANPDTKRRWFLEGREHDVEHYEMDFRTGGKECARVRYKEGTPVAGKVCTNQIGYLDIVPHRRVVFSYTMSFGEHCFSASLATFELVPTDTGTDLTFTHQGAFFEGADGPEMREAGWRTLLGRLTDVIEEAA